MSPIRVAVTVFAMIILIRAFVWILLLASLKDRYWDSSVDDLETELERLKEAKMQREKRRSMGRK